MRAAVIGGGSWGTALASLLGVNGWEVVVWAHDPDVAVRELDDIDEGRRGQCLRTEGQLDLARR